MTLASRLANSWWATALLWLAGIVTGCAPAQAESLSHYSTEELVLEADLVLLGTEVSPTKLRIESVFKGGWKDKDIEIRCLDWFGKTPSNRLGEEDSPRVTKKCVVFVSLRHGLTRIVANGIYRIDSQGKVLGYMQEINPGGYILQIKPVYESLEKVVAAIEAAMKLIPKQQEKLKRDVAAAKSSGDLGFALTQLARITSTGDRRVLQFVAGKMKGNYEEDMSLIEFFQVVPDPECHTILKAYYQKTKNVSLLDCIAAYGILEDGEFFSDLVRQAKEDSDTRKSALHGLVSLYGRLNLARNRAGCAKVREIIFKLYDEDSFVKDYVAAHPAILGTILHEGSVRRLEQLLASLKRDKSNLQGEVQGSLAQCRRNLENLKSSNPLKKEVPSSREPRR